MRHKGVRMSLITWASALVREMFVGLVCSMGHHEGYEEGNGFFFVVLWGFISNFFS